MTQDLIKHFHNTAWPTFSELANPRGISRIDINLNGFKKHIINEEAAEIFPGTRLFIGGIAATLSGATYQLFIDISGYNIDLFIFRI